MFLQNKLCRDLPCKFCQYKFLEHLSSDFVPLVLRHGLRGGLRVGVGRLHRVQHGFQHVQHALLLAHVVGDGDALLGQLEQVFFPRVFGVALERSAKSFPVSGSGDDIRKLRRGHLGQAPFLFDGNCRPEELKFFAVNQHQLIKFASVGFFLFGVFEFALHFGLSTFLDFPFLFRSFLEKLQFECQRNFKFRNAILAEAASGSDRFVAEEGFAHGDQLLEGQLDLDGRGGGKFAHEIVWWYAILFQQEYSFQRIE